MTGKTHIGVGLATSVLVVDKMSLEITPMAILICIIASTLPDADHPKGVLNKYILPIRNKAFKVSMYMAIGITVIVLNYFYLTHAYLYALGGALIIIGISSHRNGLTHSLLGFIMFSYILGYATVSMDAKTRMLYMASFIVGYGSHIICDMCTNRGVPLLYPFTKKKFKMPLTFKVGSGFGNIIEGVLIAVCLIYLTIKIPIMMINMK